jgi:hypothetical protein
MPVDVQTAIRIDARERRWRPTPPTPRTPPAGTRTSKRSS